MADWYCMVNGQRYGPLSQQQLQSWLSEGRIAPTDLVWCEGMAGWQPAGQVGGFSQASYAPLPPSSLPRGKGMPAWAVALIVVGSLALVAVPIGAWLLLARKGGGEEARRVRCRNNLNQLAKGMATYLNEHGDNRFYPWPVGRPGCGDATNPDFGGAEWLASLYWTRTIPDPGVYLCPSSPDGNEQGAALGDFGGPGGNRLAKGAVSYAAFGDRSVGIYLVSKQNKTGTYAASRMAIRDDFPPNEPMACDDTQEPINHGKRDNGGMNVLFFDSHVEYWTHTRVDLETGVGQGDLCALRN